mmetsp:Transcript_20229/g.32607  ORF Transcript_20229/g.32607 Transcript_20229/m.32607 type:complete len:104 (+) Transcript_20229:115-426(+)
MPCAQAARDRGRNVEIVMQNLNLVSRNEDTAVLSSLSSEPSANTMETAMKNTGMKHRRWSAMGSSSSPSLESSPLNDLPLCSMMHLQKRRQRNYFSGCHSHSM